MKTTMRKHFLFLFLDGVGLGPLDPESNPLAAADMPNLRALLGGQPLVAEIAPYENGRASLIGLDAALGVGGMPQSATGQATLLTGLNVPGEIGQHYGPKPNPPVSAILKRENVFKKLRQYGFTAALLNAYPDGYFKGINSGKRIYSAIPMAVTSADLTLMTAGDLYAGRAISADFTGQGWRDHLGYEDCPVFSPAQAGATLAKLALEHDFSFFEYWLSDYIGHKQDQSAALPALEVLDGVLGGLLAAWDDSQGLILLTSDHGNLEDLKTRRHTDNHVPGLVIGASNFRQQFLDGMTDLSGITPAIYRFFNLPEGSNGKG